MSVLFFSLLFLALSQASRVVIEPDARPHLVPAHFSVLGKAAPGQEISLYIGFAPSNKEKLTETLHLTADPSSSVYGKWWTKQQVDDLVAPTAEAEGKVLSWLVSENILSASERAQFESGARLAKLSRKTPLFWDLRCTVAQAEVLLRVSFSLFRNTEKADQTPIVRTTDRYSVPFEVASALSLVGNVFRFPSDLAVRVERSKEPEGLAITPPVLTARYNVTIPPYTPKNVQAVASFLDQYYSVADTALFGKDFFPGVDCSITKTVGGNDDSKPTIEAALDTQYIQFGNCSVSTWDYSTAGQTDIGNEPFLKWLLEVDAECTAGFCPYVYSMSYGDYENTITDAYAASVDFEFQMISLTGRTFLAASGDGGVGCTDLGYGPGSYNCSYFNPIFIASCPHVLACGATTTSSLERNAYFSGGGFSDKFGRPSYQGAAVASYLASDQQVPPTTFFNQYGRGFPDVGVAGVNFMVYVEGHKIPVDGTSASTPAMAAMVSMMNSVRLTANLPPLGFINPFFYAASAANSASFVDVAGGSTQSQGCCGHSFTAVPGWEPVCGLGAPDYGVLVDMAMSSTFIPGLTN